MFFNEEKLSELASDAENLIDRYKGEYCNMKKAFDNGAGYEVLWAEGSAEPYNTNLITDIENGTLRKILKSEPENKALGSRHFYDGNTPVCSVCFDERGDFFLEKFYFRSGNVLTGVQYYVPLGTLDEVSIETSDSDGKPVQYSRFCIRKPLREDEKIIMESHVQPFRKVWITMVLQISSLTNKSR